MKIGPKIRRLRKLRGLTIEELAENADLTKGFISQLERDITVPSVINLKQVVEVLVHYYISTCVPAYQYIFLHDKIRT